MLEIAGYDHSLKTKGVFPNCNICVNITFPNPAANPSPRSDGLRSAFVNDMKLHGAKITRSKEKLEVGIHCTVVIQNITMNAM